MNEHQQESCRLLARVLERVHPPTAAHCRRVTVLSGRIGRALGWPAATVADIEWAARVHDIGKIAMPREWLDRPGPLSDEEYQRMQEHVAEGVDLLRGVVPPAVVDIVHAHHERWDGQGYPRRVAGEDIPHGGRVLATADALDAMMHRRRALSWDEAVTEARQLAGAQFDPAIVAVVAALPAPPGE